MSRTAQSPVRRVALRLAAGGALLVLTSAQVAPPAGWEPMGWQTEAYEVRLDRGSGRGGTDCVLLRAHPDARPAEKSFAGVSQKVPAEPYRGRRLRMSAWVRTEDVTGWAGLLLRIDGPGREILAVDNMRDRRIRGTSGWNRHEATLEVPEEAEFVVFGIFLRGHGTVRADDFELDLVDPRVEVTQPPVEELRRRETSR